MFRTFLAVLAAAFLAAPVSPQDARDLTTPVGHVNLLGVTAGTINSTVAQGYRLTNLTYRGSGLLGATFDAVFAQNAGPYATGWWWYTALTAAQVSSNLTANQARLIDLEPYDDGNGNLRFACIMVDNTGAQAKGWWWYYNSSTAALTSLATTNNGRIVDFDRYTVNGTTYYSAVMIHNTGADYRANWWYINVTPGQIATYLGNNSARLYAIQPNGTGRFDCLMIRDTSYPHWYWWYDLTGSDIPYLLGQYGVRPIDLVTYLTTSGRRWAMVAINNSNALTTSVGDLMRSATDGQVGLWLQQINGPILANLNGDTVFEPASTMKTLHHVHAMHRVLLGLPLTTQLTVYSGYSPTNLSCPVDVNPFSQGLQSVLFDMMDASDNARTQAVRAYFGEANINATAAALGMASTGLHHRIGCGAEALANPNEITLHDLQRLHEQVANGYLGSYRQLFYDLMTNSLGDLDLYTVIDTEGIALGLSAATRQSFKNMTQMAHKKGHYDLVNGGPSWSDRSEFGWISIPFLVNHAVAPREYGFGAWVNHASTDLGASTALYVHAIPELLRPTIRAALVSWTNNLATVQSVGTGCGSTAYAQTVTGLPRPGTVVQYFASPGFPSQLLVMGLGFSTTTWGGIPLPASLVPYGSEPGCVAINDVAQSYVGIANVAGQGTFPITLPGSTAYLGIAYLTQFYTFGSSGFRTSNSIRSTIGM